MKKKIFSKEKWLEDAKKRYTEEERENLEEALTGWVTKCDGKEVIGNMCRRLCCL